MVDIKDFKRILQPLQQDTLQTKINFLNQVQTCLEKTPSEIQHHLQHTKPLVMVNKERAAYSIARSIVC